LKCNLQFKALRGQFYLFFFDFTVLELSIKLKAIALLQLGKKRSLHESFIE